jgi:hypothetical protein
MVVLLEIPCDGKEFTVWNASKRSLIVEDPMNAWGGYGTP